MGLPWGKRASWAAQGTVSSIHSVSCLCFENGYIFAHFMCVHSISVLLVLVFLAIYRPLVQLSWYLCKFGPSVLYLLLILCFSVWKFDSLSWTCTVWSLTFTPRVPIVLEPLTVLVHIFKPSLWKIETRRLSPEFKAGQDCIATTTTTTIATFKPPQKQNNKKKESN